ncbi:uncharacterized protein VICG_01453 [Vittaforma corneae ATCC 50505]|uniref:Uncharacterized protein n=1 Tax=Vittaforma corneae (strain ATCC 50505) TaxID=993615 RepID=L2GLE8_VITCO|nr:uncharacterized protein VICG_01453 [Vittaforma corneae ATCC 50505]ELA41469.1 hypothetical protein VICG_01453 [Vittaforma corneae ATCC 50505]
MPEDIKQAADQQMATRQIGVRSSVVESVYLQLELRKVLQTHHKFPTTFVYPVGRLCFEGITYSGSITKFTVIKENIKETWKIKLDGSTSFEDSLCYSLGDAFCKYFSKY